MALKIARFISIFLAALAFGLTYAHVMELPGQRALSGAEWLAVQHTFYGGYAITGAIAEIVGLLATLVVLALVRHRPVMRILLLLAALCPVAMLVFYFIGNAPLNAQIASWTPTTLPADWQQVRDAWSSWHVASAVAAFIWLVLLLATTLYDTPTNAKRHSLST
jgi:hypothetical protein